MMLPEVDLRVARADGDAGGWRVVHLHLSEGLSRVFACTLVVAHPAPAPDLSSWVGEEVSVSISRGEVGRRVAGVVRRAEALGSTGGWGFARVEVAPSLWTLSLRQSSRIWQDVPVATIVRDVLRDAGIHQSEGALEVAPSVQGLPPREYCVQYQEDDLAFLSRLLEEEGIPYALATAEGGETLSLLGRERAPSRVPTLDGAAVPVLDAGVATHTAESVRWLRAARQMRPTGALLRDFDFTHPDASRDMTRASPGEAGRHVVYEFPARFTMGAYDNASRAYGRHAGESWARVRGEQLRAEADTAAGESNVTGLAPGLLLALAGHEDEALDGDHLVVSAEHRALAASDLPDALWESEGFRAMLRAAGVSADELTDPGSPVQRYVNRFVAVAARVPWRPQRTQRRPVISGPQTAMVAASPGSTDEICVDAHGRVLVRFHWERPEQRGGAQAALGASCWVRVAQAWAGAAWGAMVLPRVGMEVVVHFLDGDPDRPLVTGCVYNGRNAPPYELPAHKTRSAFKTSSSPGGGGFNELRFEDLAGHEQVWLHAERDHDVMVKHDATVTVGHDRTHTVHHDEQLTVANDRATSVRRNDSLEVEGSRSVAVHGGGGLSVRVDARYRLEADAGIVLTCGASSIELLPDRVTVSSKTVHVVGSSLVNINGKLVKINCDAAPTTAKPDLAGLMATKALSLVGTPGGVLDKLKGLLDPKALAGFASGKVGALLTKLGVPQRIVERLQGLASTVVEELASALKEGRRPQWAKLGEAALGAAVGVAVGEVFRPLERLGAVQRNPLLKGLVEEAKRTAETAATWGSLHAVGLHEGMARDPFWQVLRERHGEAWKSLLLDVAKEAGRRALDALRGRRGQAQAEGVQQLALARGVEAGVPAALGAGRTTS